MDGFVAGSESIHKIIHFQWVVTCFLFLSVELNDKLAFLYV